MLRVLYLLLALSAPTAAAFAAPSSGQIDPPRIEEATMVLDGVLDEAVWDRAAVLRGFTQYLPVDGRPAEDSTVVLVWYSATAIHFGIRAYELHGPVAATLADRDKAVAEDEIRILLDTYNDRRQAVMLAVNPLGQQKDGILKDSGTSGRFSGSRGGYSIDLNPDFVYASRGRLTEFGYEVEISVPFKSLPYQSAETQEWGLQVSRIVQHSGYEHAWSPTSQADASYLSQIGILGGLTGLRRGLVLDVAPEVTGGIRRAAGDDAPWDRDVPEKVGLNVRWGVSENLTLNGSVNPDYSQVEADVAQLQFDPREALYFPEKRPFFLEGSEQFSTPTQLIYTRRIADPRGAVKLTGKAGSTSIGVLSAVDRAADDDAFVGAVRLRRDLAGQNTLGLVYTDRMVGDDWNQVAAVDGRLVSGILGLTYQFGGSFTSEGGERASSPMWNVSGGASGKNASLSVSTYGFGEDFRADAGFLPRVGVTETTIAPRYTVFGDEGARVESFTGGITLNGRWDYDRFVDAQGPNDRKFHVNTSARLRGGWSTGLSIFYESFLTPTGLYDNFFVERQEAGVAVDTVAFEADHRLINLGGWYTLGTPRIGGWSSNIMLVFGRDDNFDEWSSADIYLATVTVRWNPTDQIRGELRYTHQQYVRANDKTTVRMRRVPRLKFEYQATPSLFFRVVGQYDSSYRDALRDNSRSEDPILVLNRATGEYSRTTEVRRNFFSMDYLVSYRPTPGTVVFLGYGRSQMEPDTYRFARFTRLQDGFFVKLSYRVRA